VLIFWLKCIIDFLREQLKHNINTKEIRTNLNIPKKLSYSDCITCTLGIRFKVDAIFDCLVFEYGTIVTLNHYIYNNFY